MGTNYYHLPKDPCPCCGRPYEARHIGKHSAGWAFLFEAYPEDGIAYARDWRRVLANGYIKDEYGWVVSFKEFWEMVDNSKGNLTAMSAPNPQRNYYDDEFIDEEGYRISKWNNFS